MCRHRFFPRLPPTGAPNVFQEEKEKEKTCISFLFLKETHVLDLSSIYYSPRSLQLAAGTAQRGIRAEIYKRASGTAAVGSLGSIHLLGLRGCISRCAHQPLQTSFLSPEFYLAQINVLSATDSAPGQISSVVIRAVHGGEEISTELSDVAKDPFTPKKRC